MSSIFPLFYIHIHKKFATYTSIWPHLQGTYSLLYLFFILGNETFEVFLHSELTSNKHLSQHCCSDDKLIIHFPTVAYIIVNQIILDLVPCT